MKASELKIGQLFFFTNYVADYYVEDGALYTAARGGKAEEHVFMRLATDDGHKIHLGQLAYAIIVPEAVRGQVTYMGADCEVTPVTRTVDL